MLLDISSEDEADEALNWFGDSQRKEIKILIK